MIYLDTSALIKLLVAEKESAALATWLTTHGPVWFTSTLTEVELPLSAARHGLPLGSSERLLDRTHLVDITADVRTAAAGYGSLGLRTLDAIHVASATSVHSVDAPITVVSYDTRRLTASEQLGMATASPGRPRAG